MTLISRPEPTGNSIKGSSVWPWVEATAGFADAAPPAGAAAWPKISIVTPNYNYADLIETTLRSVLVQNYPNLEYIVIDDGSTDASVDIIRKYGAQLGHWEHHANQGQYSTINKGFARATGEICGWINSDDIYLPWTLRSVGAVFAQFPEVDWIIGHPSRIQDGTVHAVGKLVPYPRELLRAGLFHGGPGGLGWIQQESCFWRRSLWEKAGGLRPEFRYAADYELWTRFAEHADLYAVTTLLGGFTVRGNQNRSIANRERYLAEVKNAQDAIAARAGNARNDAGLTKAVGSISRFQKVEKVRGLNRFAKRLLSLKKYRGPVLKWDFDQSTYRKVLVPFFD